jgi:hypothetical protein
MTGVVRIGVVRGGDTTLRRTLAPEEPGPRTTSAGGWTGWQTNRPAPISAAAPPAFDESQHHGRILHRPPASPNQESPYGQPGKRADPPSAPTPPMGGLHQPPGQRVTRGDRSRGKSDTPRSPAAPSMRLQGLSTAGIRRRDDGTIDACRTDSHDPRYTKMRPGWAASSSKAPFLLDRRSVKKTCRGQVFSAAPAELISAGGNHAGAENGVHSPGISHPPEGPPPQGLTCGSSSSWPPRSTPGP